MIIYWYDWLQCTCSKLTQVQDIMRHGLTFNTSNKQLNRPSSAYRGIFRQIKHTYFIFFKHILFILRIKTTNPIFLVSQSMRTVHKHSSLTIPSFWFMVQHSPKNVSTSYLKLINLNISIWIFFINVCESFTLVYMDYLIGVISTEESTEFK